VTFQLFSNIYTAVECNIRFCSLPWYRYRRRSTLN